MLYDPDDIEQELARISAEFGKAKERVDSAMAKLRRDIRTEASRQHRHVHIDDARPEPSAPSFLDGLIVRLDLASAIDLQDRLQGALDTVKQAVRDALRDAAIPTTSPTHETTPPSDNFAQGRRVL